MECRECYQSELVNALTKQVDRLENDLKESNKRINDLERKTDVNEEQTKMVFKILSEIKDDIKTIANKLDALEKQPGEKWREIVKTVITTGVAILVTYLFMKAGIK